MRRLKTHVLVLLAERQQYKSKRIIQHVTGVGISLVPVEVQCHTQADSSLVKVFENSSVRHSDIYDTSFQQSYCWRHIAFRRNRGRDGKDAQKEAKSIQNVYGTL